MAATTSPPRRPRTRIRFQLDSLDLSDGRVVVTGRWHGVRGLRFVRPTLIVDGDEVLATLEHKPWPAAADPWVAEFPWEDGRIDPRRTALSVAPSVTVPLVWPGDEPDEDPEPAENRAPTERQDRLRSLQVEYDALQGRLDEAIRDRDDALRLRNVAERERDDLSRRLDEATAEKRALREQIKKFKSDRRREPAPPIRRDQHTARDDERPIGTREMTAADYLASSGNGATTPHHPHETSVGERTASRLFGAAAFACALLLVVNLLGLFF